MNDPKRTLAGVPAGGEFAVTAHAPSDVTLLPDAPASPVQAALERAQAQRQLADRAIADATTHLIAAQILRDHPGAAYLVLDEDDEALDGQRKLLAGAVHDGEGAELVDLKTLAHFADRTPSNLKLAGDVDHLLRQLDGVAMTDLSPAVSDPFADDHAWAAARQRRLHLPTAMRLFDAETERSELVELVDAARKTAGQAPSYPEATAVLTEALGVYLVKTVPAREEGPITDVTVYVDTDHNGETAYSPYVTVGYSSYAEEIDLDGTPGAELIYALTTVVPMRTTALTPITTTIGDPS